MIDVTPHKKAKKDRNKSEVEEGGRFVQKELSKFRDVLVRSHMSKYHMCYYFSRHPDRIFVIVSVQGTSICNRLTGSLMSIMQVPQRNSRREIRARDSG